MLKRSQLMKFCMSVLTSLDMDDEKAHDTSEILIEADMMGHSTHGVRLLPLYIKDIEVGNMKVKGEEVIVKDFGSSVVGVWSWYWVSGLFLWLYCLVV